MRRLHLIFRDEEQSGETLLLPEKHWYHHNFDIRSQLFVIVIIIIVGIIIIMILTSDLKFVIVIIVGINSAARQNGSLDWIPGGQDGLPGEGPAQALLLHLGQPQPLLLRLPFLHLAWHNLSFCHLELDWAVNWRLGWVQLVTSVPKRKFINLLCWFYTHPLLGKLGCGNKKSPTN